MRSAARAVAFLLAEFKALFAESRSAEWFLLLCALVLQAGFWYAATPGPALLRFAAQSPLSAVSAVAWSALFLLLIPGIIYRLSVGRLAGAGLQYGDWRFGLAALAGLSMIAIPLVAAASLDPALARTYPWPGRWAGESAANLALWLITYSLYYLAFEAFYRGFVLFTAERAIGATQALWLQAVMATLVHLGKPLAELLAAAPASLLFGLLALRTRSVLYPALLHLVVGATLDITLLARTGALAW